jgi:tetratricopeptide (TPR) repeat protein
MDIKRVNWLCKRVERKMNNGDFHGALKEVRKIKNPVGDHYSSYMVSGNLIDIGNTLGREDIVQEGVELLEKHKEALLSKQHLKYSVLYNLSNGHDILFSFEKNKDPLAAYFKRSRLNDVKKYYLEALNCAKSIDHRHVSQIWTNLGNCFDKFGRVVEALECFEKALELDPNHGMAMANKGDKLLGYAHIAGDHFGTFLNESYHLISIALEKGVNPESRNYFLGKLNKIEISYPDKKITGSRPNLPGVKVEGDSELEKFLVRYCLDNKLYLNICNVCQKCNASVGDTLGIITMLVPDNSKTKKTDPFLRLSSYLNQMKQDYVTARFLLVLSRFKNLDLHFVDKRVKIINSFDSNIPNIHIQLTRFAFKNFYDILDKIAIFINDYLKLGMKENKIYFTNVWYSKYESKTIHSEIMGIKNFSLNAIFDISQELAGNGRHHNLNEIRNALTHRFFDITPITDAENDESMSEEKFVEHTLEIARLVRSSLIYLMHFVFIEEQKRISEIEEQKLKSGIEPKIHQIKARAIPDEKKRF